MKEYPSIPYGPIEEEKVYVYPKWDGSNIRAEWSKKQGWYKFGSRHHLIDENDKQLGEAVTLFKKNFAEILDQVFHVDKYKKAILFLEFWGHRSSHGNHIDEPHMLYLIDIALENRGILLPSEYLKFCERWGVDYTRGFGPHKWTYEDSEEVRNGKHPLQSYEGVVCKADKFVSPGVPLMWKLKSKAWLNKYPKEARWACSDLGQ